MEDKQNSQSIARLIAENGFLKMKILAEHGVYFSSGDRNVNVPPDLENHFLNHIVEFEEELKLNKRIKVFEKIGKPQHFKAVNEISDVEIEEAWQDLSEYILDYGIELSACSPKVTSRELYRFATEELFDLEIDDIEVPGMINGFIYDEFYPDVEYDNSRTAIYHCIRSILTSQPLEYIYFMGEQNIRLNEHYPLERKEFKDLINRFKNSYDSLELLQTEQIDVASTENTCIVKGTYEAAAHLGNEILELKGNWKIGFELMGTYPDWYVMNVQVEGINF